VGEGFSWLGAGGKRESEGPGCGAVPYLPAPTKRRRQSSEVGARSAGTWGAAMGKTSQQTVYDRGSATRIAAPIKTVIQSPMISKPTRLKFDGVKQLQTSELEKSPMFTPLGSPSAADQEDRIETSTPPTSKLEQRAVAGSATTPMIKRQPLAPMARQPQLTAEAGAQQDAAAQALLGLLADCAHAARPESARIRNRHESLRQARMAHHRLRISLGVQLRS